MHKILIYITCIICILVACDDYDSFETNDLQTLRFSADSIVFDTTFVKLPTVTKTLIVWNDNNKGLKIKDLSLTNGENSKFQINVDGESLDGVMHDIEIRGHDSIFIFVRPNIGNNDNQPAVTHEDNILITLDNGRVMSLPLKSVFLDADIHNEPVEISSDETWNAISKPRVFLAGIDVKQGATLTIEEGVTLFFSATSSLDIHGRIIINGTLDKPVIMRGHRLDKLFENLSYDNTPSRWMGMRLYENSGPHNINYADIHSSAWGIWAESTKFDLNNSIIHNVDSDAVNLYNTQANIINTQISNALCHCVNITGGNANFIHCTIAQFYGFSIPGEALKIGTIDRKRQSDIQSIVFSNCLITGLQNDVLKGEFTDDIDSDEVNYLFNSCVLRTTEVDNDHYQNITWENYRNDKDENTLQGSKQFQLYNTQNFLFDFRLNSNSIAVGACDHIISLKYPYDRDGKDRTENPAAGCYQF